MIVPLFIHLPVTEMRQSDKKITKNTILALLKTIMNVQDQMKDFKGVISIVKS
jgi:hypothetical protein